LGLASEPVGSRQTAFRAHSIRPSGRSVENRSCSNRGSVAEWSWRVFLRCVEDPQTIPRDRRTCARRSACALR